MKCPTDDTVLQITERHGIEVDYCATCRGVWLDRGELDKVVEVATREVRRTVPFEDPRDRIWREDIRTWDDDARDRRGDDWDDDRDGWDRPRPRKRRSLLGEVFDFGD